MLGSSPRVRGKPLTSRSAVLKIGLIPACAGKTLWRRGLREARAAHPRVCGENPFASGAPSTKPGSSPRVRGKQGDLVLALQVAGLIPACAGKTHREATSTSRETAHPRVCGENVLIPFQTLLTPGSSPRVRGKHRLGRNLTLRRRLIPACAGKTMVHAMMGRPVPAHPRVCGENLGGGAIKAENEGSSPRVRGKQKRPRAGAGLWGLIPACAGKTLSPSLSAARTSAHPRVCGENCETRNPTRVQIGSSPRVRGKQKAAQVRKRTCGLIPACAGKTAPRQSPPPMNWAHPRVCGENQAVRYESTYQQGSSPRVRGKPTDL